ncbi:MAG: phosphatidylserine decarboxylase family protein [Candidatus Aminicenantes bacterium]|nr:phosphatidylserine decarboxylase family protein [Candidatus Aminicenantes bacterium]
MKIAKEGLIFIIPFLVLSIVFLWFGLWILSALCLIIASKFTFFFRDPVRKIPEDENSILSPADGKIVKIQTCDNHPFFSSPVTIVSVFLSIFNVHITRAPISGEVTEIEYHPGKFFPAYKDEAGLKNESNSIYINGNDTNIIVKQIVGIAARRIKCFVIKRQKIIRGQKMGLMYFGSRVDIFLPKEIRLNVQLNQKVKAGETEIAYIEKG